MRTLCPGLAAVKAVLDPSSAWGLGSPYKCIGQSFASGFILLILIAVSSPLAGGESPAGAAGEDVIVIFRAGTSIGQREHISSALPLPLLGSLAPTSAQRLTHHPDVVAIVPDSPVECPCEAE